MFAATIVATSIAASRGQPDFTSLCIALYPSFASAYGVPPLTVASISAGTGATASVANEARATVSTEAIFASTWSSWPHSNAYLGNQPATLFASTLIGIGIMSATHASSETTLLPAKSPESESQIIRRDGDILEEVSKYTSICEKISAPIACVIC